MERRWARPNPPIDQVAAIIRQKMEPGDGVILAENTAMRWGLAYYLRHDGTHVLDGLDVSSEWDYHQLIRTPEAALSHRRDWVVLPEQEPSSVDLTALKGKKRLEFLASRSNTTVMLFGSD